ncbi:hypothetical protein CBL_06112 [Carabus blaptoides fortunei]
MNEPGHFNSATAAGVALVTRGEMLNLTASWEKRAWKAYRTRRSCKKEIYINNPVTRQSTVRIQCEQARERCAMFKDPFQLEPILPSSSDNNCARNMAVDRHTPTMFVTNELVYTISQFNSCSYMDLPKYVGLRIDLRPIVRKALQPRSILFPLRAVRSKHLIHFANETITHCSCADTF